MTGCGETRDFDQPDSASATARARSQPAVTAEALEASLMAAEQYLQTRDLAKSEAILLRLLDRAPSEPRALELHGQVLMAKAADARDRGDHAGADGLFNEAYERYRALTALQPDSAGLQQSAGEVAQVAGRNDQALEHYQQAHELDPNELKPHFFTAQILIERGEYEQAIESLRQVLKIDPDEPLAYASLATIAVQQERYEQALEHIAEARSIRPDDVSFRVIEASIYRRRGDARRGLELLVALPSRQRGTWFVAEELAAAYSAIGEHERAAASWALAHRSNPGHPRAHIAAAGAGAAMLRAGQRQEAHHWLQQARLDAPQAPETQALAAALAAGDPAEAGPPSD